MPQPLSDYFALEAGEYLDQLDGLLKGPEAPDASQLFRLARGVRGSAQIAGVNGIARVAERLEEGARSLRDGTLAWDEEVRQRAVRTLDDIRVLMRARGRWGEAEESRARDAVARWGGEEAQRAAGATQAGDQLFAFVRREITGVVAELERAMGELRDSPASREPLRAVLRRMRPVRGVAGMDPLAPILEVLEGIEEAVHDTVSRAAGAEIGSLDLLGAAAEALRAAGTTLERGEAPGDTPELERFREVRDAGVTEEEAAEEADVVPVTALFHDDEGPHIVSSPMAPVAGSVGVGPAAEVESFLRIEATGFLDRADGLVAGSGVRKKRFARVAAQLADLAASVRDLAGTYGLREVSAAADTASTALRASKSPDEARAALAELRGSIPGAAPREEAAAPASDGDAADAASATKAKKEDAPDAAKENSEEDGVVDVDSLVYEPADALREALSLRERVVALAGAGAGGGSPLGEVLDELFGLVELGLNERRSA